MLRLENVSKSFTGVKALSAVSLEIESAEIHAVCGENGAGKSTLMKIIAGSEQPDADSKIFLGGERVNFRNAADARNCHISIVYQERSLIGDLSVSENIYLNNYPVNSLGRSTMTCCISKRAKY